MQTRPNRVLDLKSHSPDHGLKGNTGSAVETPINDIDMAEASTEATEVVQTSPDPHTTLMSQNGKTL